MTVKVRPYRGKPGVFEVDISVTLPNGKLFRQRVKSPVPSKSGARRWGEERESHVVLNWKSTLELEQRKDVPTLTAFFPRFIEEYAVANRHKPSVLEHKRVIFKGHLQPRFGDVKLDEISNTHIAQLKAALADRSPKTVNNVLSNLNVILKAALEWGVIDRLPCAIKLLRLPIKESEFYDHEQYARLVAAAAKIDWRIHALVLLGGDAGLRRGEIMAVKQTDFSHQHGKITVEESDWKGHVTAPKNGRTRRVGLTARLVKVVQGNRHLRSQRLLTRDDGSPIDARTVRGWMEQAQRLAGLKVTGKVHVLRHTFCSHLAMAGATLMQIKELAGHASVTTTQRYMHLAPGNADQGIGLLEKARNGSSFGEMLEKDSARS